MKTKKLFPKLMLICFVFSLSAFGKENIKIIKHNSFSYTQENMEKLFQKRFPGRFTNEKHLLTNTAVPKIDENVTIIYTSPPGNDNFANRFSISGASGSINGSNVAATHEPDEPWILPFFVNGTNSVWWTWTCPASGFYGFDTICSGFDTAMGVFTGNELSNLEKVTFGNNISFLGNIFSSCSYLNFNAIAGQTYQITVSGAHDSSEGNILLNWYPDTLIVYSNSVSTNSHNETWLASDGSMMRTYSLINGNKAYKTNIKEIIVIDFINENIFTNVNITNSKNIKIVDINAFSNITGKVMWISDFDGKRVLVAEQKASTNDDVYVHLFAVNKKGLKNINTFYVSNNFGYANFSKKWIYVVNINWSDWSAEKLSALNKNMKKIAWEYIPPFTDGWLINSFPNGVAVYAKQGPTNYWFDVSKKGKPYGAHTLKIPDSGGLSFWFDDKGGMLFWKWDDGTNYPMTYIDRKGNEIVKDFSPDKFLLSNISLFDGKTLVLGDLSAGIADIQAYNWGKNPKLNGETTVAGYNRSSRLIDSKLYIITTNVNDIAVSEFDRKLKKIKWENSGPGYDVPYIDKGVFYRTNTNATSRIFTIFKKKKNIAEHTIDK